MAISPPQRPGSTRRSSALFGWVLVASLGITFVAGLAGLGVLALALWGVAGTSMTRRDFSNEAEAVAFVDAHLPVALPSGATVPELTYERFTDWHLEAKVRLGDSAAIGDFLERSRRAALENDEYCGKASADEVGYFLSSGAACGVLRHGALPGSLEVRCYTR